MEQHRNDTSYILEFKLRTIFSGFRILIIRIIIHVSVSTFQAVEAGSRGENDRGKCVDGYVSPWETNSVSKRARVGGITSA